MFIFVKNTNNLMMALIKSVKGKTPIFGDNVYKAENSTIVGDVIIGNNCSIWFAAVIRGDVNSIRIGNNVNIQDGAVIHCTFKKFKTILGNNISIGHNAVVHGCIINDNVLVGIGAIVMDGAIIESNTIIAAGAVVLEGTRVESGSIFAGVPAKKVKELNSEQTGHLIKGISKNYLIYSSWFKD